MPDYGMFGRVWLAAMKEYHLPEYRRLEKAGQLQTETLKFDAQATLAHEQAFQEFMKQFPPPANHPQRAGHFTMLSEMAREQVIADMIPLPQPEEFPIAGSITDSVMTIL